MTEENGDQFQIQRPHIRLIEHNGKHIMNFATFAFFPSLA